MRTEDDSVCGLASGERRLGEGILVVVDGDSAEIVVADLELEVGNVC